MMFRISNGMKDKFWLKLARVLPERLVYQCGIEIWAQATGGVYDSTDVNEIPVSLAMKRYARIHAIPGHGDDKFYNSNRGRK